MNKVSVLIVEDSIIFSEGLKLILKQHHLIEDVCVSHSFEDTLLVLKNKSIDIVFLDLNFETNEYDGFVIAKKIKQLYSDQIKIIVLTQHARVYIYKKLFNECGVDAYLDKQLGIQETFLAIKMVINNEKYVDENISKMLEIEHWMKISRRENDVILHLINGLTQKEIGNLLCISSKTVEKHISNLMKKLNVKNSVELIAKYIRYKSANRENMNEGISLP